MKLFTGIDPGKIGAIVSLNEDGSIYQQKIIPTIGKEIDIMSLWQIIHITPHNHIVLEHVHAIQGAGSSSNFSFGHVCGVLQGLIMGSEVSHTLVTPKQWQKEMWQGVPEQRKPGKKDKNGNFRKGPVDTKAMSLIAAKRLFPLVDLRASERAKKPHDGIVDALLMAEYCRRKFA